MIEEIPHAGWQRNLRIDDGTATLIVTLDVGPRILHAAPNGAPNLFAALPDQLGGAGEKEWKIRGGHRFWTAPEAEHSYALDNDPIAYRTVGQGIEIASPATAFGWQKTLGIASHGAGRFTVTHTLKNTGATPLAVVPWALSVMAPGGTAVIPQPPPQLHPNDLPPGAPFTTDDFQFNRRVVLWKYTHLNDPRLRLEPAFWFVEQRSSPGIHALKFGLHFQNKWVAYQLGKSTFAKTAPCIAGADYPDAGSNLELYTDKNILELETLAPLGPIAPGGSRTHVEEWRIGTWEESLATAAAAERFFQTLG